MDLLHNGDEIFIFLHDDSKKCDFEIIFDKTIKLSERYECAVVDINLPDNLRIEKIKEEMSIDVQFLWKNLNLTSFYKHSDKKFFDEEKTSKYEPKFTIKFQLIPNLKTPDEITAAINNAISNQTILEFIEKSYKSRFQDATLKVGQNLILPRISFDNGKFKNVQGGIRFTGLHKNKYAELSLAITNGQSNAAPMEDVFKKHSSIFYTHKIAYLYLTFDRKLHDILGFDKSFFPNIKASYDSKLGNLLEQKQEGFAIKNFDNEARILFVISNITEDIWFGNDSKKILRIINNKTYSNQNINFHHFNNLMFIPLRVEELHSVRIKICDSTEEPAVYEEGFVTLTLHLRPYQYGV